MSVDDQNENISRQIEDINIPLMKQDNTIILAIQDATQVTTNQIIEVTTPRPITSQDIGTSTALEKALADDVDPTGERTIGVLTKIDKIDAASDKNSLVKVLKNETKPLPKYGYFGVINRSLNIHDSDHLTMML